MFFVNDSWPDHNDLASAGTSMQIALRKTYACHNVVSTLSFSNSTQALRALTGSSARLTVRPLLSLVNAVPEMDMTMQYRASSKAPTAWEERRRDTCQQCFSFESKNVRLWRPCWTEGHGKRSSFNPWCLSLQYHYQQLQLAKDHLIYWGSSTSRHLKHFWHLLNVQSEGWGECLWPPISSKWCRAPWTFGCWPQGFLTDKLDRSFMELLIFGRSLALKSPRLGSRRKQPGTLVLGAPWGDDMETPFSSSVLVRASALHNSAEMLELDFKQTASGHSLIGWCGGWFSDLLNYYELFNIIHDFIFQASQCFAVNEP